jgi:hypothetical protein
MQVSKAETVTVESSGRGANFESISLSPRYVRVCPVIETLELGIAPDSALTVPPLAGVGERSVGVWTAELGAKDFFSALLKVNRDFGAFAWRFDSTAVSSSFI